VVLPGPPLVEATAIIDMKPPGFSTIMMHISRGKLASGQIGELAYRQSGKKAIGQIAICLSTFTLCDTKRCMVRHSGTGYPPL
jgi:hypothetical protein